MISTISQSVLSNMAVIDSCLVRYSVFSSSEPELGGGSFHSQFRCTHVNFFPFFSSVLVDQSVFFYYYNCDYCNNLFVDGIQLGNTLVKISPSLPSL